MKIRGSCIGLRCTDELHRDSNQMKFSHSLQFNAVPEWSSKYIAYSALKKVIYKLQREQLVDAHNASAYVDDPEHQPLNHENAAETPIAAFTKVLDKELTKIDHFYNSKEEEIYDSFDGLINEISEVVEQFEPSTDSSEYSSVRNYVSQLIQHIRAGTVATDEGISHILSNDSFRSGEEERRNSTDLNIPIHKVQSSTSDLFDTSDFAFVSKTGLSIKNRTTEMFVTLSELKSFIELNKVGFTKALKKFDKTLDTKLKDKYLASLPDNSYVFQQSTLDVLNAKIEAIIRIYALIATKNDVAKAAYSLRSHLRDYVVWERNTVWRDMISMERKSQAASAKSRADGAIGQTPVRISGDEKIRVPFGKRVFYLPKPSKRSAMGIFIFSLTLAILMLPLFEDKQQNDCFGLLICCSLLWATETIPLYVTSLFVPLLIVVLKVLKNPETGAQMPAVDASKFILSSMWSSVIMLLLGGFTLAAVLSKYHIDRLASTWILSKAGTRPQTVLLVIMGVSLFASMWVSNVAAPVLMFSIIQPLLRPLPEGSPFAKALIMGIAFASNVGGTASPIASPQNIVAIGSMFPQPSWGQWFVITLPICFVCVVLIWILLLMTFDTKSAVIPPIRKIDDKFTGTQWYITVVSIFTIILWCLASKLEGVFGEMGIIAIIPIVLFYAPGLLVTQDINNYPWNIVLLAMGGLALGKAVSSSGLLTTIAMVIKAHVESFNLFSVMLVFGILILVMATFVSHTVAALIIIPLVKEIGDSLSDPHPNLLVMSSALLCSCAMALPTSGFPNVTAICMVDEVGKAYLSVGSFITRGIPASLICYGVIVTMGYLLMRWINF